MNIAPRVNDVLDQFMLDHCVASYNVSKPEFKVRAKMLKLLCDKYRKEPEPGDTLISAELTLNGGSFNFHVMEELTHASKENECRHHFLAASSKSVLIEPLDYPNIEPYNRQSPYYTGLGYAQYEEPVSSETLRVYIQKGNYKTSMYTSFDEYHFNDFWSNVTIGLAIKKEDIESFLLKLGKVLNFDIIIMEQIINLSEK